MKCILRRYQVNMDKLISSKKYEINYYDIDYKKRVLLSTLMKYFSDIAVHQSAERGIDLNYMLEHNIAWVLYKWDITVSRYPMYGEEITVNTEPYSFRKFYAYRKYEVKNSQGEVLVTANSIWFLIDIEKRRPIRIPKIMYTAFGLTDEDNEALDMGKIASVSKIDYEKEFQVRYSDIDTNRHVNNVKYAEWALETVPLDIVKNYSLKKIYMAYEKETTYGDIIKVQTQLLSKGDEVVFAHRILDGEGKEINAAETVWQRWQRDVLFATTII